MDTEKLNIHLHKISAFYNHEAVSEYHAIYDLPVCHAEDIIVNKTFNNLTPSGNILDIGCGDGLFPSINTNLNGNYAGLDVSRELLLKAKTSAPELHFANADMHMMPYPDEHFSSIISMYGPFSYSLNPNLILDEFDRVTQPGAKYLIMPYTLRTGHSIELGGKSTAVNQEIQKIFYTKDSLRKVLTDRYKNTEILGLNYFVNPVTRMITEGSIKPGQFKPDFFNKLIDLWSNMMGVKPPNINNELFEELSEAWNNTKNIQLSVHDLEKLLWVEQKFAAEVPAEYARHMMVVITR